MSYTYKRSTITEIQPLIDGYIKTLSSPFDSYLEDHIVESDFFSIYIDGLAIGYFSFNKEFYITQFYLERKYIKYSQLIFKDILEQYQIKSALVFTGDELFLSLVLDQEILIKKQAYFFQDSGATIDEATLYQGGSFRLATKGDISLILQVSDDFFDSLEARIERGEIFVFKDGEILLGAGIVEHGRVLKGYTSIGMFVNEQYRQKGIGRTIITKLKLWCYEKDITPICGCWYYNHNSKKTLESAGMLTKTRLLNVAFVDSVNSL
ncbi:MAG: GCN5-related N-acetyltransferase [Clostridia bacterium]|jgi:GNAT superfamily N-acetyltransferase|nr:GCN5-related N-acetyltransferase [Clostridia bacterium]